MTDEHPDHDAMAELYDKATSTEIARHMVGRLTYCHLIDRLTDGNLEASIEAMDNPGTMAAAEAEFNELTDTERDELVTLVRARVNVNLSEAILHMWHACKLLDYNPEGLDPRYVVLVASMLLSEAPKKPA